MIRDVIKENENVKPNSKELAILREHFPSCFTSEGNFDIERFKEFLNDEVNITNDGYELKFLGKNYARLLASLDSTCCIEPDNEHNNKPENINSNNIYISGDNLDGLKELIKSYADSIKCIYIDPPYNTGSDGFVYNDKFDFSVNDLSEKLSIDNEQAQRILDLTKRGSASHSAWLMFMYPRLLLAKDLLAEDGVIFISIDDNEQGNLRLMCDDIFGEQNFVGQITVVANPRGRDYGGIARMHDYILTYTKNDLSELNLIEDENNEFKLFDEKGGFELRELRNRNVKFNKDNRPNLYYPFYINPDDVDDNGLHSISLEPKDGWIELYPLESQGINVVWRLYLLI
ncbi:MAG: site-specific DNA-methyltransferase [Erysipelotrichaceae bacterium]|nr:site-specific DNA-methyltransferase [Erysipelotrichaceae bacterium]